MYLKIKNLEESIIFKDRYCRELFTGDVHPLVAAPPLRGAYLQTTRKLNSNFCGLRAVKKPELEGSETEKVWVIKPFPLSASRSLIMLQNKLLATQICCQIHCSADVKGSDILTKIAVVSNKAAILDTECMKLLFRGHTLCS